MSEHVHEWTFNTVEQYGVTGEEPMFQVLSAIASCLECGDRMGPSGMEKKLNATEQLSVEDARKIEDALDGRYIWWMQLRAYATALEGEDA